MLKKTEEEIQNGLIRYPRFFYDYGI